MSGALSIIPTEIISKEIISFFNTQAVCSFARVSTTTLALTALAAKLPQKDTNLKGERVMTFALNKEDKTIKALLQQKLKTEILDLHPYLPVFVEIAGYATNRDSLEDLIHYARRQGNTDATMLSLAFYDFKTKMMSSLDLERALKLAVQFPNNTRFIQAILSHENAVGIGGATLGIVLLEVIKEDHLKLVQKVLSFPNAPTIGPAILNQAILNTDQPQVIRCVLLHPKTIWIRGKSLASGLISAVKANHPETIETILYHPNAADISSHVLRQAVAIARKNGYLEALLTLLSFIEEA